MANASVVESPRRRLDSDEGTLDRLLEDARVVQRRVSAVSRQSPADDAGRPRSAWRIARAAGGMVRDLPRRERAGAAAAARLRRSGGPTGASHLGDRSRERDYREFFTGEVRRLGIGPAVAAYLPTLTPGIAGSALHSFMRLSLRRHAERSGGGRRGARLLVRGLSRALPGDRRGAGHRRSGRSAHRHEAGRGVSGTSSPSSTSLALHARDGEEAGVSRRGRPAADRTGLAAARRQGIARALRRHDGFLCAPRPDRVALAARPLARASATRSGAPLFLAGDRRALSKNRVPGSSLRRSSSTNGGARRCPTGRRSRRPPSKCDDEHDISLAFSAFEEWKFYGDPLYRFVAARRVRLMA